MPRQRRSGEVEYGGKGGFDKIARTEMAKIKAAMIGEEPEEVSPFEKAAQELIRREEQSKRRKPFSGAGSRDDGMPLVSFHQMPLRRKAGPEDEEEGFPWQPMPMPGTEDRPKRIKMNGAMIAYIALNLKAREWNKAMGTAKSQRRKMEEGFEREAERWAARRLVAGARGTPKGP